MSGGLRRSTSALLFAMGLALVSLTRAEPRQISAATSLRYGQLSRGAPVAAAGAAISGLLTGAFYALVPAWMEERRNETADVEKTCSSVFPAEGHLSERQGLQRRIAIAALG
jgi:hypothetical protein